MTNDTPTDRETVERIIAELDADGDIRQDVLPLRAAGTVRALLARIEELEVALKRTEAKYEGAYVPRGERQTGGGA